MNRIIRGAWMGIAPMLLISLPLVTPVRAAAPLPAVLVQAQQAIQAAHSYKVTDTIVSIDSFGATSSSDVLTIVRQGNTLEAYVVGTDRQTDGKTTTSETVIGAKHTCTRANGRGAWNCTLPNMGGLLNSTTSFTPVASKTNHYTWSPAGTRTVHGQACAGFNETATTPTLQSHGTIWFSLAGKLPVLATEHGTHFNKAYPSYSSKDTTTMVWSNWNDPSLRIPNVGA